MATFEEQVNITNHLLLTLNKMSESFNIVKSIGDDVNAMAEEVRIIKERLESIEARVRIMDETPSKSNLQSINETLERYLKPLDQIEVIDGRVGSLERSMATVSMGAENPTIDFHSRRKGRHVVLTNDGMCAERTEPLEDYGEYGAFLSDVPLLEGSLFQIRIEETIDKWIDFGISIGVISDKEDAEVEGAASIIGSIKGTWAINSWDDTTCGTSNIWRDTEIITRNGYPLDTRLLKVGTILGIKVCSNGDLRFFLNGEDKGVAFNNVPKNVYAFVDVVNYVTKISVLK